jgi:hypothetical protein
MDVESSDCFGLVPKQRESSWPLHIQLTESLVFSVPSFFTPDVDYLKP